MSLIIVKPPDNKLTNYCKNPRSGLAERSYYNSLCHLCKLYSSTALRCSTCKVVAYCSKEHQTADWPSHKVMCSIIKNNSFEDISCYESFTRRRFLTWSQWRYKFHDPNSNPHKLVHQMSMFPRMCWVCYEFAERWDSLEDCKCRCVVYCRKHKNRAIAKHAESCDELSLCREVDQFLETCEDTLGLEKRLIEYINVEKLPETTWEAFKPDINVTKIEKILVCEWTGLSYFLTLINGLSISEITLNQNIGILTIHIIGASVEMLFDWKLCEKLFKNCVSKTCRFQIILIGPTVVDSFCPIENDDFRVICKRKLYHELPSDEKPDFVAVFNSGFWNDEDITWMESLEKLRKMEVPVLMTGYTINELAFDVTKAYHKTVDISYFKKAFINPFANLRPVRNWNWKYSDEIVFYNNQWFLVFKCVPKETV